MAWWRAASALIGAALGSWGWFDREANVEPGEPFELTAHRSARIQGQKIRLEEGDGGRWVVIDGVFDDPETRVAVAQLPQVVDNGAQFLELSVVKSAPTLQLVASVWRGIALSGPARVSWAKASFEQDRGPQRAGDPPRLRFLSLPITVRYSFETRRLEGAAAMGAQKAIAIRVRAAGGREGSGTLGWLEQANFTSRTGVAPSWAPPPPSLAASRPVADEQRGNATVDVGPLVDRPSATTTLEIEAALGPYRSTPITVVVDP